ncbi:ubiquitin-conjugating enzyme E2-binding protein [Xylogone sp. PMI_703]|nr:ubiquitin-conjugating enzyme E2-binding protein [Xylogone sp. PMI_703]
MSLSCPLLYAEVLTNIKQISIVAVLGSTCNRSTRAELKDGERLIVYHEGLNTSLKLPRRVNSIASLPIPPSANKEITWRLQITDSRQASDVDGVKENPTPWPAKILRPDFELICHDCNAVILEKGRIQSWRDLPSDNWAEMMDFWHCHKPSDHSEENPSMAHRGYGANTKLAAQEGIGFVDMTTLLLSGKDCPGVKVENSADDARESDDCLLLCSNCNNYVGRVDHRAEGFRLYKWTLKINSESETQPAYPPQLSIELVIAGHLISTMDAQCCSQFLFIPSEWHNYTPNTVEDSTILRIWIMNPSLRFASSRSKSQDAVLAMKVFYKSIPANNAVKLLEDGRERLEEVRLPRKAIRDIQHYITGTTEFLPPSARRFQDWNVGSWRRYEG